MKNSKNNIDLKKNNRNRVYRLVYQSGKISKPEIALRLGISMPTALQNVKQLMEKGLLKEGEPLGSTGGRKAISISCADDVKFAVGVDLTKSHISVLIINIVGGILHSRRASVTYSNTEQYYKRVASMIEALITESKIIPSKILGVGVSMPGIVSKDGQVLSNSYVLQVEGLNFSNLTRFVPYKCILCNDANAAGFAETWSTQNNRNALYISLSNSVGGAIIFENRLLLGDNQRAGEFGHITIENDGPKCYCGKRGCLDVYCSALVLSKHTNNRLEEFFQKLEQGDKKFGKIWDVYLDYLAIGVNNLRMTFDCTVILGGYVGSYLGKYLDVLESKVGARDTFDSTGRYLQVCQYKREAAAVGSALQYVKIFIDEI